MRFVLLFTLILPVSALAETFTLRSAPKSVMVYPEGAMVQRVLTVAIPAGTHDIIVPDLPEPASVTTPRVVVTGATLNLVTTRNNALLPLADAEPQAILQARAEVKSRQAALTAHLDEERTVRLQSEAAAAQIAFLNGLSRNESLPTDSAGLRDITDMIGTKTLSARQNILNAEKTIRDMGDAREDLEKDLKSAQDALDALTTATDDRSQIALKLSSDAATTAEISISYLVNAYWEPVYDVYLDQTEPAQLSIKRGALVTQESGEDWQGVSLTLSTLQPSVYIMPGHLNPQRLTIFEPSKAKPVTTQADLVGRALAEPVVEAPVIMEEAESAGVYFDGPGVSYVFSSPVDVANGVDAARIALDTLSFEAEVFARAVPLRDETAFIVARFTNTAPEPLFEAFETFHYFDNGLVGLADMPQIPAGAEGELFFGPTEDLRLERVVLDRTEGDSGIINRSSTRDEEVRITVENLGSKTWPVELQDRVPFGEQEDLIISYTATPQPDHQNLDDRRGILQWDFDLAGAAQETVVLRQNIKWPEGQRLR